MHKLGQQSRCVLTGHETPMNTLIDWTTLKPVSYWSYPMLKNLESNDQFIITSICFFGGIPESNIYVFSLNKSIGFYFYSSIQQTISYELTFYQELNDLRLSWVNHTRYVLASFKWDPSSTQYSYYFYKIDKKSFIYARTEKTLTPIARKAVREMPVAKIFLEMGAGPDSQNDLEVFYLAYFTASNTFFIQPPIHEWDVCLGFSTWVVQETLQPQNEIKVVPIQQMIYGRLQHCHECDFNERNFRREKKFWLDDLNSNRTFSNCQQKECSEVDSEGNRYLPHHRWGVTFSKGSRGGLAQDMIAVSLIVSNFEGGCFSCLPPEVYAQARREPLSCARS